MFKRTLAKFGVLPAVLELNNVLPKFDTWAANGLERLEKKQNLTLIHGLISHELQKLNFEEKLLKSKLSTTKNLDTSTTVVSEILAIHLRSFLVVFLTLTLFERRRVRIPNFQEELLRSRLSVTGNLDALTAVLCEISTFQLKSFLVDFLTLSISEQKLVKIPNFGEELLRASLSVTEN